jgi:LysM repeat protein
MRRVPLILACACACLFALPAKADDAPSVQELHELRQAVDQQSKQIELLAEQVGRLTKFLEGQKAPESAPAAATTSPAPTTSVEAPKPAPDAAPEAPKNEAVPKAEVVAGGPKHAVAKGETLTSIAKHYNISIADLKNANKIENERKLQIGQILTIPTAKAPETADKKENN